MTRLLLALALSIGATAVPILTVSACSCAFTELPQAIAQADVAFVGTLVSVSEPPAGPMEQPMTMTWAVERSRDALDEPTVSVAGVPENGANCGVTFATDERWLVLGYVQEGRLETNGCMHNVRMDGSDAESEAVVDELVTTAAPEGPTADPGISVPTPLLVVGAALLALAAVGAIAFRRPAAGS